MYFQPQLNHKLTRHKRKTSTLEFVTFFSHQNFGSEAYPAHAWKPDHELTASSRRRPDGRSSSAAIQVAAQGRPRCIFQTPAAKRVNDSVPSITSCSCQASRQWTQPSGLELCACVLFKGRVMMSVIHREHAPSPDWKTRGCKHQRRAMRSMLPFMKSFCLLIVPCARPASLLLLIPTPQQCHNSPTTITQQSHSSPHGGSSFFFSLGSHFFQAHVLISWEVWGSQHGPLSPSLSESLRRRRRTE